MVNINSTAATPASAVTVH